MGFESVSGVVLNRRVVGEGDLLLTLFLREAGVIPVSARGAATGKVRFGGGTEPLIWGIFTLYRNKGGEEGRRHLKSVDVADDMLKLRRRPEALFAAARWARLLTRHLAGPSLSGHPADDLLANLYWNMKLLCDERLPVEAVEWRFLWRWLRAWGLAPDLNGLDELGKNFTRAPCEIDLLQKAAFANTDRLKDLAGDPGSRRALMAAKKLFAGAARQAEGFLREM